MVRNMEWKMKVEQQWQTYDSIYGTDWTVLCKHKKTQDTERIKAEGLSEIVEVIIDAYFGCYSELLGVESEYPKGKVALNLEMESGYPYPAIIPMFDRGSILHVFEKYRVKRVNDLEGKHILVYHCDRRLRAVRIPDDDFVLWTDLMVEEHEDYLCEQLSGR